jgi:hypothetical protein
MLLSSVAVLLSEPCNVLLDAASLNANETLPDGLSSKAGGLLASLMLPGLRLELETGLILELDLGPLSKAAMGVIRVLLGVLLGFLSGSLIGIL